MRGFSPTVELDLGGGETALCFHGSPSSNMEGIYAVTPDETLARILGDAQARTLLCGHTHLQIRTRSRSLPGRSTGSSVTTRAGSTST